MSVISPHILQLYLQEETRNRLDQLGQAPGRDADPIFFLPIETFSKHTVIKYNSI